VAVNILLPVHSSTIDTVPAVETTPVGMYS
jgi:hypothetical protein